VVLASLDDERRRLEIAHPLHQGRAHELELEEEPGRDLVVDERILHVRAHDVLIVREHGRKDHVALREPGPEADQRLRRLHLEERRPES